MCTDIQGLTATPKDLLPTGNLRSRLSLLVSPFSAVWQLKSDIEAEMGVGFAGRGGSGDQGGDRDHRLH